MTKHEIKAVLDRVLTWSPEMQEEAVELLRALGGEQIYYTPTPEEAEAIRKGLAEAERGDFASDEEVVELLERPWTK
jgi:predicted transcriptional regulator